MTNCLQLLKIEAVTYDYWLIMWIAFYNGVRMSVCTKPFLEMRGKLVGTEYGVVRESVALDSKLLSVERILKEGEVRGVRAMGSSALACCYVAKQSLDVFWEAGIHIWFVYFVFVDFRDICAGVVIVGETGGRVVNWDNGKEVGCLELDLFCRKFLVVRGCEGDVKDAVKIVSQYLGPISLEPDYKF